MYSYYIQDIYQNIVSFGKNACNAALIHSLNTIRLNGLKIIAKI